MRRAAALAVLGIAVPASAATAVPASAATAVPAGAASVQTRMLSGSCSFSGPITPIPPITIAPKPGAHFDYTGTGSCTGTFDGEHVQRLPITVTFTNVATAFDTCELGPDFDLRGTLAAASTDFAITIDLARVALFGPFSLTTPGGGSAIGFAQFEPPNTAQAIAQCGSAGIATATLAARLQTTSPLVGAVVAVPPKPVRRHSHKRHRRHARHRASGRVSRRHR